MVRRGRGLSVCALALYVPASGIAATVPTYPGDCNLDWSVDLEDHAILTDCLAGPGIAPAGASCVCFDQDGDGDVDLGDAAAFQAAFTGSIVVTRQIGDDADDGTEITSSVTQWQNNGYLGSGINRIGSGDGESYTAGLRFELPDVMQGETFVYARLILPAAGGEADFGTVLKIYGVAEDCAPGFDVAPPHACPRTAASVEWIIPTVWPEPTIDIDCGPLRRYSADISPIVNEIVSRPGWGVGAEGKVIALLLESGPGQSGFLAFHDYRSITNPMCPGTLAPALELFRTPISTFVARELLSRPTATSVTVTAMSQIDLEAFIEYGVAPGVYLERTLLRFWPRGQPMTISLEGLEPDTRYYYRLRFRRPGTPDFDSTPQRTFHTQRAAGSAFTFTVQADSHLQAARRKHLLASERLYRLALRNQLEDEPDFLIDLGDTFHCEFYEGRDVLDAEEAIERHLDQRPFLDLACHSVPFFFVLGNHEGEQGWQLDGTLDNVAAWAAAARKLLYPLPEPDAFYTGCTDVTLVGLRQNYYAWQWGDALFIVLDPYWYTTTMPQTYFPGGGSGNNWDWTLGRDQYLWLRDTLRASDATFRFVFAHQVTGGVNNYGRGGAEAARNVFAGMATYEWGGEDQEGNNVFAAYRPGWGDGQSIHDLMCSNGVTIFFHGHDHVFVEQDVDGIVYQECPQPSNVGYDYGYYGDGLYSIGVHLPNSGHLRVTVAPTNAQVDYIRAFLPQHGSNGQLAYSYTVPAASR